MTRDPRITPVVGDIIKQRGGLILRVTKVVDGRVSWQKKTRHGWKDDNCWTIEGWQTVVAHGARVVELSDQEGDNRD